jgi:hypothetical protein
MQKAMRIPSYDEKKRKKEEEKNLMKIFHFHAI